MTPFDTYHCLSPLLTFDLKGYIKGEKRTHKQQNNDTENCYSNSVFDLPSTETMVNELSIASPY